MEYGTSSHIILSHISTKLKATPHTQHLDSPNQRTEGMKCTTSGRHTRERLSWEPSKEVDEQLVTDKGLKMAFPSAWVDWEDFMSTTNKLISMPDIQWEMH